MSGFIPVCDPLLDEMRAEFITGGTGGGVEQYVGGYRTAIAGQTISFNPSADIVNVTGTSVTLQPDTAYKIYATSQAITLNANPPAAGKWAYEGHLEIFVAGTGYVMTGSNVVLANALEPDSVNNCTVRFHDGIAIISVEDHVAGYIVVNASTSGAGSLAYGLSTATNEYISIDAALNGQTLDLAGATTYAGEKHVVGNGYAETILTGGITCTSKTTFSNLSMDGVVASGGTMTLGDVFIPSGSTVSVSGGGLAVEKVTGNGGVIDLGGTHVVASSGTTAYIENCVLSNGSASYGGALNVPSGGVATVVSCTFKDNISDDGRGFYNNGTLLISACEFALSPNQTAFLYGGITTFKDTKIPPGVVGKNSSLEAVLEGSNTLPNGGLISAGHVTIKSGAIINMTGNSYVSPIELNGGITVEDGGCQVITSAGTTVSIVGGTYTKIKNDGTTE